MEKSKEFKIFVLDFKGLIIGIKLSLIVEFTTGMA